MADDQNTEDIITEKADEDLNLCCIEASVVTGFEECARGEAKEKFGTTVHAARGKIVWKVPIDRVTEVVKMGSIDNCRVVLKSIPHFKFTDDQHDSLGRLQKMVIDMDWGKGLRVWRQFFDFAHPIASQPDVIPTPEELVDIVIIERKFHKDPNSRRNNKKGGRGKKKERKKDKRNEDKITGDGNAKSENAEEVCGENHNVSAESNVDSQCHPDTGDQKSEEEADKNHQNNEKIIEESFESGRASEANGGSMEKPIEVNGRTSVFIKRPDPNRPEPKIEVKVLIPGPNEDVFPTQLNDKDHRDEEPMDVDMSVNVGNEQTGSSVDEGVKSAIALDEENHSTDEESAKEESADVRESNVDCIQSLDEDKENKLEQIVSATKDFASSVIEKLKSSSPSSDNVLTTSHDKVCTTPPSTPVVLTTDPMMNTFICTQSHSPKVESDLNGKLQDADLVIGSSVDPSPLKGSEFAALSKGDEILTNGSETAPLTKEVSPVKSDKKFDAPDSVELESGKSISDSPNKKEENKKERDPTKPTFRVTCNRVGEGHAFDSSSAAACLGSAIVRYFNWGVDLKNFDIEVLLNIDNEEVTVGIGLTKSSLHNRNLIAFGPTTLRATICYNMLRLCRIKTGDIVCDPMCGTSALPIEGALNWTNSFHFGGDFHELAMGRSVRNMDALQEKQRKERANLKIGLVQWDINNFPLREKCVDVFVSDLPFGHRMGSRAGNRTLYPALLSEMARTARNGARACLLTEDRTSLVKAIQTCGRFWQRRLILSINMGGLSGFVFLLTRTTTSYLASMGALGGGDSQAIQVKTNDGVRIEKNHPEGDSSTSSSETPTAKGEHQVSGAKLQSDAQTIPTVKSEITAEGENLEIDTELPKGTQTIPTSEITAKVDNLENDAELPKATQTIPTVESEITAEGENLKIDTELPKGTQTIPTSENEITAKVDNLEIDAELPKGVQTILTSESEITAKGENLEIDSELPKCTQMTPTTESEIAAKGENLEGHADLSSGSQSVSTSEKCVVELARGAEVDGTTGGETQVYKESE